MQGAWENLSDPVFDQASARGDAIALTQGKRTVNYREFAEKVAKASVFMRDLGVKPGEVVGVAMATSIDHAIVSFGLMRAGAIPLDLPPKPMPGAIINPVQLFGVGRLIRESSAFAAPAGVTVHEADAAFLSELDAKRGDFREVRDADEVHNFSMTSGSTGFPKGVLTTRRQWLARFDTALKLFPDILTPDHPPTLLVIGGMSFSAFFFFLANQLFIGGPVVLMAENPNEKFLRDEINNWDDAVSLITPPLARKFLALPVEDGVLFPKLRALFIGAAPLYPDEKAAVLKKLTPNFREVYGSAACGFISSLNTEEISTHGDSVGRPAPGVEVEAVDANGTPVPAGSFGHLRIRGPGISKGFVSEKGTDADKAEGFRDGWYYPGDLGGFDANGYIQLKGRLSDVIYRRGAEIMPLELEQIFAGHESVADAAVVGAPSEDKTSKDQRVIVFIVPRGEPDKAALAQYCRARIPEAKFPDRVFFVKSLPKNANGKTDRAKLKALARRGPEKKPAEAPKTQPVQTPADQQKKREARAKEQPLRFPGGRPDIGAAQTILAVEGQLNGLSNELFVKPQPNCSLSRGERELLAVAAAAANGCFRSMDVHGACVIELLGKEGADIASLVEDVKRGVFARLDPKMRALAELARTVAVTPRQMAQSFIDAAAKAGAKDTDIALAVAIASADAMYSSRMEAMRAPTSANPKDYVPMAREIAKKGYAIGAPPPSAMAGAAPKVIRTQRSK